MNISDIEDSLPEPWRDGVETRMLVSARNGAAQLCIFEQWVAPGAGAPTHTHSVEEVLSVRAGQAEIWLDAQRAVVTSGQCLVIPGGVRHGFRNCGEGTLHVQAVLASPVFEAMMEGATEPTRRWEHPGTRADQA